MGGGGDTGVALCDPCDRIVEPNVVQKPYFGGRRDCEQNAAAEQAKPEGKTTIAREKREDAPSISSPRFSVSMRHTSNKVVFRREIELGCLRSRTTLAD